MTPEANLRPPHVHMRLHTYMNIHTHLYAKFCKKSKQLSLTLTNCSAAPPASCATETSTHPIQLPPETNSTHSSPFPTILKLVSSRVDYYKMCLKCLSVNYPFHLSRNLKDYLTTQTETAELLGLKLQRLSLTQEANGVRPKTPESHLLTRTPLYLNFSTVGLDGVLPTEEKPLSLSEESPNLRDSQSLRGL